MPSADRIKSFALRHVWILPILMVAVWLRTAGIGSEHLYGDEAEYSIVARYLSRDPTYLAYPDITGLGATPFVSQPPLILYLMALSMTIFGATDVAALVPSILFGTALVAATYALGLRLGGRLVGLGSAAIVATLPFTVEMSRRAMLDSGYVFFLVLAAYFCVAWLQERRARQAVGIGVAVACAALSKLPGVLAGPIVLIVLLMALAVALAKRDKPLVKQTLKHGALGAIPVAVGAALYLGLLSYLDSIGNLMLKLEWQFGRVSTDHAQVQELAAFERPATWYFTDPKFSFQNELMPLVFALALVGLAAVLFRFAFRTRRLEDMVVPIFAFALLTFFMWSDRKEGFYLLPFAPLAAILVAEAANSLRMLLEWGGVRFTSALPRHVSVAALAMGVVLVAAPAYGAASETMDDFVRGNDQEKYFGYGTKEAAQFVHERDPDAAMYGTLLGRFALHWYNEQDAYHWYIDHTRLENAIKNGELRYIVYEDYLNLAFDREYMRDLIHKYNGEKVAEFEKGWGEVQVFELHP